MIINLEYASQEKQDGTIAVKPFCYATDDKLDSDGGAPIREANYAQHLIHKFTDRLPVGEYDTCPPPDDWKPVFRIQISIAQVHRTFVDYCILGYQRLDFSGVFNSLCSKYMEFYARLKRIARAAHKRDKEAEANKANNTATSNYKVA